MIAACGIAGCGGSSGTAAPASPASADAKSDSAALAPAAPADEDVSATDRPVPCKPAGGEVAVSFPQGYSVIDLAIWYMDVTCATVMVPRQIMGRRTRRPVDMKIQAAQAAETFTTLLGHLRLEGFAEAEVAMVFPPESGLGADPDDATLLLGARSPTLDVEELETDEPVAEPVAEPEPVAESQPSQAAAATQPQAPSAPKSDSELDGLLDKGISKVGASHYKVTSELRDKVLANPMAVARGARVVPSVKNGQPDGFKLYAIRPGSVYARLGFENGDTIHAINGQSISGVDKALEAYNAVKDAKRLEVTITRRGQPGSLVFEIE